MWCLQISTWDKPSQIQSAVKQGSDHIKASKSASLNQICQTYQHVFQTKSNSKAHLSQVNWNWWWDF